MRSHRPPYGHRPLHRRVFLLRFRDEHRIYVLQNVRWQIELFFKWSKHHLRIKNYVRGAVRLEA